MILQTGESAWAPNRGTVLLLLVAVGCLGSGLCFGQLTSGDIAALRARGVREGWTFTVGPNPATERPLSELCGLVIPENWSEGAVFDPCEPARDLPVAFDWRDYGGCTPVRDQGGCGSCWAFATVGPLESNILLKDGLSVDLSEQWLVSCNMSGWSCGGGWYAHSYHKSKYDPCGGVGAVLEADFPYEARDLDCDCPYEHRYRIDGWAYIGTDEGVPPASSIKQAIWDHGPVSVAVYTDSPFHAYDGGIFNACTNNTPNHAVVLVGWDDNQGPDGVWIMRNSWGPGWGEGGYMRIPYNCSVIGFAACYVNYSAADCNDNGIPDWCDVHCGTVGEFCDIPDCGGSADCNSNLIPDECEEDCNDNGQPDDCDLASGFSEDINGNDVPDECDPDCNGNDVPDDYDISIGTSFDCNKNDYPDECDISSGRSPDCQPNGVPDECDLLPPTEIPAEDDCAVAAMACTNNAYYGSTVGASNDGSCSCGSASGTPDIWYYYRPYGSGFLTISLCGSSYDTVLSMHSGRPGTVENEIACNDDYCGQQSQLRDVLVFDGTEYWIRVSGRNGATGSFRIVLSGPACDYSAECNDNGIPDECEEDCNINGQPDDCDIAGGLSDDINGNGVPDECESCGGQIVGDANCDGAVDSFDIDAFVLSLNDPASWAATYPDCELLCVCDCNEDGQVNTFDIDAFVVLLTGG